MFLLGFIFGCSATVAVIFLFIAGGARYASRGNDGMAKEK